MFLKINRCATDDAGNNYCVRMYTTNDRDVIYSFLEIEENITAKGLEKLLVDMECCGNSMSIGFNVELCKVIRYDIELYDDNHKRFFYRHRSHIDALSNAKM